MIKEQSVVQVFGLDEVNSEELGTRLTNIW